MHLEIHLMRGDTPVYSFTLPVYTTGTSWVGKLPPVLTHEGEMFVSLSVTAIGELLSDPADEPAIVEYENSD